MVTTEQIRAARAMPRLDQEEIARRAAVSVVTIRRIEAAQGGDRVAPATMDAVRSILEQAGAEFIPDGVRRRPSSAARFEVLRAISLRSAAKLPVPPELSEADLYDEDGLPA